MPIVVMDVENCIFPRKFEGCRIIDCIQLKHDSLKGAAAHLWLGMFCKISYEVQIRVYIFLISIFLALVMDG